MSWETQVMLTCAMFYCFGALTPIAGLLIWVDRQNNPPHTTAPVGFYSPTAGGREVGTEPAGVQGDGESPWP